MECAAQGLIDKASALVDAARRVGADEADAVVIHAHAYSINVRLGKVEATEFSASDILSLRVFIGKRMASVSANMTTEPEMLAIRAITMAKVSPENPFEGLADSCQLIDNPHCLDLFDSFQPDSTRLTEDALAIESAALDVCGVTNSGGAGTSYGIGGLVLVTSRGFCGHYMSSRFERSCSVIAGEGTSMECDYDSSSSLHFADMKPCEIVGRCAGERVVRRLGPRQAETGVINAIFDPRVARSIAAHLSAMVNGLSVARKTSLLRGDMVPDHLMEKELEVYLWIL